MILRVSKSSWNNLNLKLRNGLEGRPRCECSKVICSANWVDCKAVFIHVRSETSNIQIQNTKTEIQETNIEIKKSSACNKKAWNTRSTSSHWKWLSETSESRSSSIEVRNILNQENESSPDLSKIVTDIANVLLTASHFRDIYIYIAHQGTTAPANL